MKDLYMETDEVQIPNIIRTVRDDITLKDMHASILINNNIESMKSRSFKVNIDRKIEGIVGLGPQGQPLLFSKRAVEHLLEDKRTVKQVVYNTKQEKNRNGVSYTVGWFEEVGK